MKGSKFKTVIVYPFDVPEYRSKYVFIDRTGIRDEIRQGQYAKRALKAAIYNIESLEGVVKKYERLAGTATTSYMRDYYNNQAIEWFEKKMREVRYKRKCRVDMMHHGHEANRLENPPQPRSTHDEWVRAHDVARLSRRPYRRPARTNQRVAAFDYEDAAEHDVVDRSQLRWQRLVLVLAIILRNAQRRADSFIQPAFTGLGRTVRRCSGCLNVRPISEFPSIRTMWCNRCIEHDILLLS